MRHDRTTLLRGVLVLATSLASPEDDDQECAEFFMGVYLAARAYFDSKGCDLDIRAFAAKRGIPMVKPS